MKIIEMKSVDVLVGALGILMWVGYVVGRKS